MGDMRKLLGTATLVTFTFASLHLWMLDGLDGLILSMILEEQTEYAPGYTDRGFRDVKVGMSENKVYALIGDPLDEWTINQGKAVKSKYAAWSNSPMDTHYRRRIIGLENDRVVEVTSDFWVD